MSYNHLAGRLIEVQRSMLGQPAITIAQSIGGITVSNDGNVKTIEGDGREIIGQLFERYTQMLGDPAENRLRTAASEFEDELDLPQALGGSAAADVSDTADSEDDTVDSDATSIEIESPSTDPDSPAGDAVTEPRTLRRDYEIQGGTYTDATGDSDLSDVYLLREEDGWQVPISVEEAIVEAVASMAGRRDEEVGRIGEYTEPGEILSVLGSETETVASFEVDNSVVVVHPSGTIAVRQQ